MCRGILLNSDDANEHSGMRPTGDRVLSALDDYIAVLDRHGNITQVNDSWTRFAQNNGAAPGYTGVGSNYLEICRHSLPMCPNAQQVLAGIQAVMDGSAPYFRSEYRCDSNSEQRWFALTVKPLPEPEGGVVVCHSDISELGKVRDEYSTVLDAAEAILWRAKLPDFQTTFASKHVERILGYPVSSWLQQPHFWREHIHPEDRDRVLAFMTRATEEQRSHDFEYRMIAANGQTVWLRNIVNVVVENGVAAELVGVSVDIRERKRVEEELRQSNTQLRTTIDSISDGLLIMDSEWRYTFFSERAAAIVGVKREDMLGRVVWDLFPHAKGTKFYEGYHRAVETGQPQHFYEYYPEPLNQWLECHCYPSKEGLTVYFHDVTDRKRAEEALRNSEVQFRTLAEAIPQLCWMATPDGSIFWYNQRWYDYTGTTAEQMEGWGWQTVHDPRTLPAVLARWKSSIATGEPFDMVFPLRGADGIFRPFLTRIVPLKDTRGQVIRWFGTNTDITELRDAEQALRTSEEKFRRVVEHIGDALFTDDVDGRVVFANERFLNLFGFEREELPNLRLEDYVAPEYRVVLRERHQRRMSGEAAVPTHFEYEGLRRDGTRMWLEVDVVPVADAQGKPIGTQSALRDVTDRKRAEAALADLSGRLIEAQEEERKRIARELHDDYNQRLAMVAIDLQRLAENMGESSREAGQQLHELFNQVSELSADLHSLSHRLHSSTLENLGLVAGVKAFCQEFAEQQAIQIDFAHENVPRATPGDAALCIFRIVQEALRNIKRHSGAERAEVRLTWSGERLHLSISDRGRGFEPNKPSAQRGIGVRSMEERLRMLGGQLEIHSRPMEGTRIEAWLPLTVASQRAG
jgi:PAS domain S-box-containing protein